MFNFISEDKSFIGLSYSKSVFLSSWTLSNTVSSTFITSVQPTETENDILKQSFNKNRTDSNPINTCLNWLSENKNYASSVPSDILNDYVTDRQNRNRIIEPKSTIIRKTIAFIKEKINKKRRAKIKRTTIQQLYHSQLNNIAKNQKIDNNSNENEGQLENLMEKRHEFSSNKLAKTFTQEYESYSFDSDEIRTNSIYSEREFLEKSEKSDFDISLYKSYSESKELTVASSVVKKIPELIINETRSIQRLVNLEKKRKEEPKTWYSFIDSIVKQYPSKSIVPKDYNISYTFYIYMYPSQTDANLLLFQRQELKNLCKFIDPFDVLKLIAGTKADFLFDRRLDMVQIQCNCHIVLEPLHKEYINGLPYRLINIYSSAYQNIAKALSIMEEIMPEIMQTSVFKQVLPSSFSHKWSSNDIVVRPIRKPLRSDSGNKTWFSRINPDLRYPSINYILDNTEKNENKNNKLLYQPFTETQSLQITRKGNSSLTPRLRSSSNVSDLFVEIVQKNVNKSDCSLKRENIEMISNILFNSSLKRFRFKKIKCPAYFLQTKIMLDSCALSVLFDRFHCKITKVEEQKTLDNQNCFEEGQVKITIAYISKEYLHEFCNALGLFIKQK